MRDNLDDLRHIEGFPIGEDEDLHALSDPPYYTAYPNPHIAEYIEKWGTPYDEASDDYHREPFVADVSEGKRNAIYNAHAYHTKVPHRAIIRFIEHYTEPRDIVFDGFCGTGMTGVAAQMVRRRAILCDLSPAATFITHNYNMPVDAAVLERDAKQLCNEIRAECSWMYETCHSDGRTGHINYTVWSDVFRCPYCSEEFSFWDAAVDEEAGKVHRAFQCPACRAEVTKRELRYVTERVYDSVLGLEIERNRQVPVLINYSIGSHDYEKSPSADDLHLIQKIQKSEISYWYPTNPMMFKGAEWGDQWRSGYHTGITHVHHFYTRRNLWALSTIWDRLPDSNRHFWMHAFTGAIQGLSRLQRFRPKTTFPNMILSGTLYVSSITREWNAYQWFEGKIKGLRRSFAPRAGITNDGAITTTQSTTQVLAPDASADYVFTDPPFGDNLAYSELNFIWEAWLQVFTSNRSEAIISSAQGKRLEDYRDLMTRCFKEMYRVLKPGRWITVVFHNSKARVWNAIQESLARAGFLVAQVTAMDKKQGSFNQVAAVSAVRNDLIINAYKPRTGFTQRFLSQVGQGLEAEFVRQHLAQLPVAANVERSKEMLYSKYLAYYVQQGYQVAYNAEQFYRAVPQWGLVERDNYWFADEAQANGYEKRKVKGGKKVPSPQAVLFVSDERSARQWLWDFVATPRSYDAIYTAFVKALQTPEDQIPELKTMLEEGFVRANGEWKRPDELTQAELEQRRQARLLRQFEEYLEVARAGRRLKEVRKEALIAGFTEAYRAGRFEEILKVGHRLTKRLLEASPDLFDFIDIAETKLEG